MNGFRVLLPAAIFGALSLVNVPRAGAEKGAAIVLGFHCVPVSGESQGEIPLPRIPEDLRPAAPGPGTYDVWVFLHTRAPLVGAWTITVALAFDADPQHGIEVIDWRGFSDWFTTYPGWPDSGTGFRAEWRRARCYEPDRYLVPGRDGWWIQPVLRLRVVARGPGLIMLCDPEPGVRPQMIECADEMHELDGTDSWTRVLPAVFGGGDAGVAVQSYSPALPVTWGALKIRRGDRP